MRNLLRSRFVLPGLLITTVGIGGLLAFGGGAGAQSGSGATTTTTAGAGTTTTTTTSGTGSSSTNLSSLNAAGTSVQNPQPPAQPKNTGTSNSSIKVYANGRLVAYGNSAIVYKALPQSYIPAGEALFDTFCSSCHGTNAAGTARAPNLVGLGPATVDFWVSTGRMPAENPLSVQAPQKPPKLSNKQALEVAAYINSLDPAEPYIPSVNLRGANLADGASLFALNCAACHTITGAGDALAYDTYAPSLRKVTPTQIAEAIRTGPANMPRFTGNLTDAQVRDLVAYVSEKIQHPSNPGGFGLGGVGPVAEGFVALLFGVGGLALVCFWIGERA